VAVEEIVIGIIAGLITTFLVVTVQKLWVGAIEPWYEELIYKDAKIEGEWVVTYPELQLKELVTLKRAAHRVSGVVAIVEGPDQGKTYVVEGQFKNLLLTASYGAIDRTSLDRGTYTLLLRNNGQSFEGASAFYEDSSSKIAKYDCRWDRK
jgi:hypothetical protein